jgi:GT2 family glycosyltransferase
VSEPGLRAAVSLVVVAYNGGRELLESLRAVRGAAEQVIVVENGTLSPEVAAAAEEGELQLLRPPRNLGFGGGCNLAAQHATGSVLVFLNPDVATTPGAVAELARTLDDDSIGIATARLRLTDEPALLNSSGNVLHLTGLGWVDGYRRPVEEAAEQREVAFPSGASMAIRAALFAELRGFREELFLYHEDVDLGWRVWQRGLRVVMTPAADVFHRYEFARNPEKRYLLERNRVAFVLCDYPVRLLLVLAPVLLCGELALTLLAWRQGWLREKASGWVWCARNLPLLRERRRQTQADRRVPVRELARVLTPVIDPAVVEVPAAVRLANPLLSAYWALARRLL